MRKYHFLIGLVIASLAVSSAFATNKPEPRKSAKPVATASARSAASAHSNSKSSATQHQTATGGNQSQSATGGDASQSQSADNLGNSLSVNNKDRLQAPSVSAPAVYASGSCASGWSAGLSVPGAGLSGGKSKSDPSCDRREVARVLAPLNPALALKVLCADPIVAAVATPGDCDYRAPVAPVAPADPEYVTKPELDAAFRTSVAK